MTTFTTAAKCHIFIYDSTRLIYTDHRTLITKLDIFSQSLASRLQHPTSAFLQSKRMSQQIKGHFLNYITKSSPRDPYNLDIHLNPKERDVRNQHIILLIIFLLFHGYMYYGGILLVAFVLSLLVSTCHSHSTFHCSFMHAMGLRTHSPQITSTNTLDTVT